jgi:hypothetical protein
MLIGVLDRRLVHVDLLEPPHQRAVLLEVLAELLVGGRAHAAQRAAGQRGLEQVGGVHRPPAGAPAPITVWISSMKSTAFGWFSSS